MCVCVCVCCHADGAGKLSSEDPALKARRAVSDSWRDVSKRRRPETIEILRDTVILYTILNKCSDTGVSEFIILLVIIYRPINRLHIYQTYRSLRTFFLF